MLPRFVGRLGLADVVTLANVLIGFGAVVVAPTDPGLAARLILLAAIADGLDGVLARVRGTTPFGAVLDSLADVVSFGVAPALFVFSVLLPSGFVPSLDGVLAVGVAGGFLALATVRLGLYATDDVDRSATEGVQTTLAATLLAAAYLAGIDRASVILLGTALFSLAMVSRVTYPDLRSRDALAMGVVQTLAVVVPAAYGRLFPRVLFVGACCYLLAGPLFYRRSRTDSASSGSSESNETSSTITGTIEPGQQD